MDVAVTSSIVPKFVTSGAADEDEDDNAEGLGLGLDFDVRFICSAATSQMDANNRKPTA